MTVRRRFLLPANLDRPAQQPELSKLLRRHVRRGIVATCWVDYRYPGERGWVKQADNSDPKGRVWYAHVSTWRKQPGEVV